MRTLRLARIAAEAEGLRLRHRMQRTAVQIAIGIVALACVIGALVFLHIAAWYWLRISWEPQYVGLMLAGADFVLAIVLGLLAASSHPTRVEREALAIRQQAIASAAATFAWSAMAAQLVRLVSNLVLRSRG